MKKLLMILILSMPFGMSAMKRAHYDGNTVSTGGAANESAIDTNWRGPKGETVLLKACGDGDITLVQEILTIAPNLISVPNINGFTPLHSACLKGHTEIAQMLLERDPSLISARHNNGATVLHFACFNGHTATARMLLEKDPSLTAVSTVEGILWHHAGTTALHAACWQNRIETARMLLEKDPNLIDAQMRNRKTALMIASQRCHLALVKLLLDEGADPHVIDVRGEEALDLFGPWAGEPESIECERLLREATCG